MQLTSSDSNTRVIRVQVGSATTWIPQLDSLSMSVRDLNTNPTSYIALSIA